MGCGIFSHDAQGYHCSLETNNGKFSLKIYNKDMDIKQKMMRLAAQNS